MWSKENSKIENAREKTESVKTEQSVKTKKIEALPRLNSKIARIIRVLYTYKDHAQKVTDFSIFFLGVTEKMVTGKSG